MNIDILFAAPINIEKIRPTRDYLDQGPFYKHGYTLTPSWISNHAPNEVRGEIT